MSLQFDRLDHDGIAAMLKSAEWAAAVNEAATAVAGNVTAINGDLDVAVDEYTTDRAAASVTIRDPEALALQSRDGILTRAAAAAGLEVKSR